MYDDPLLGNFHVVISFMRLLLMTPNVNQWYSSKTQFSLKKKRKGGNKNVKNIVWYGPTLCWSGLIPGIRQNEEMFGGACFGVGTVQILANLE